MVQPSLNFTLSFAGASAEAHEIDFYDVAKAIAGFQRSLALTTHVVLTGEVITQATSLRDVRILALPPEPGSWKITAAVVGTVLTGAYQLGTAPKDTPLGHLVHSAYDYIISESLGFHVDYDKTIGEQVEEIKKKNIDIELPQSKLDSVIEKCHNDVVNIHRPIWYSESATEAVITSTAYRKELIVGHEFTQETYDYMEYTTSADRYEQVLGIVSSYNINTYKGRIFLYDENRPIPFKLYGDATSRQAVAKITSSLSSNARERFSDNGNVNCTALKYYSRTGRLKFISISAVS